MSSFVIGKQEYIKAAGAVAGIVEKSFDNWRYAIHIYNHEEGRWMNSDDFYARFVECFELNAKSVYDQYHPNHPDELLYTDDNQYRHLFYEYLQLGRACYNDPGKLRNMVQNLDDFFQSSLYQTEDEESADKMGVFYNRIALALYRQLSPHECTCWGEFTA